MILEDELGWILIVCQLLIILKFLGWVALLAVFGGTFLIALPDILDLINFWFELKTYDDSL